jgi:hypothetical protein
VVRSVRQTGARWVAVNDVPRVDFIIGAAAGETRVKFRTVAESAEIVVGTTPGTLAFVAPRSGPGGVTWS